jgi:hypothetical protein
MDSLALALRGRMHAYLRRMGLFPQQSAPCEARLGLIQPLSPDTDSVPTLLGWRGHLSGEAVFLRPLKNSSCTHFSERGI